jgi:hypothetical protein
MTRVCSVRHNLGCLEDLPHGNNCFVHLPLSQKAGFSLIVLELCVMPNRTRGGNGKLPERVLGLIGLPS